MSLQAAIERNRRKHHMIKRAQLVIRHTWSRVFDYEDAGMKWKYDRMLKNARRILSRYQGKDTKNANK